MYPDTVVELFGIPVEVPVEIATSGVSVGFRKGKQGAVSFSRPFIDGWRPL